MGSTKNLCSWSKSPLRSCVRRMYLMVQTQMRIHSQRWKHEVRWSFALNSNSLQATVEMLRRDICMFSYLTRHQDAILWCVLHVKASHAHGRFGLISSIRNIRDDRGLRTTATTGFMNMLPAAVQTCCAPACQGRPIYKDFKVWRGSKHP